MKKSIIPLFAVLFLINCAVIQTMPEGTNYKSKPYYSSIDDVEFYYDLTYEKENKRTSEQEIFDLIFKRIESAKSYILIDMFLFNDFIGEEESAFRNIADELTTHLIQKKKAIPSIKIDVITDPINCAYFGGDFQQGERLKENGIHLIYTNLSELRDSNHIYAPFWRTFIQWFGNRKNAGILPHPFSPKEPNVTFRTYFSLLNFKANHRKIFLADNGNEMCSILTSANPHDGSSAHSNIAIEIKGDFWQSLYKSELAVATFSGAKLQEVPSKFYTNQNPERDYKVVLVTEKKIRDEILKTINQLTLNDELSIAMFYISDKKIVQSILNASDRGVHISLVLDPSKDAFGREKSGIPNRQVASKLWKKSKKKINIRWYDTHGEQFHTKMLYAKTKTSRATLILGSANFTKRNIGNYNLESNVWIYGESHLPLFQETESYLDQIFHNKEQHYTADYSKYEEHNLWKNFKYFFFETFGANTF